MTSEAAAGWAADAPELGGEEMVISTLHWDTVRGDGISIQ